MAYFGAYFGAAVVEVEATTSAGSPSTPVPAPLTVSDPAYENHAARMLDRLPQYAKRRVGV